MAVQYFIILVIFFSQCLGHTKFIYTTNINDKEALWCKTNKWEISTKSNNRIDVNCTLECVHGEQLELNNTQNSCTKKVSDKVGEQCPLIATSGFYRCVTALDSGFLYPFKPSRSTVTTYIIATVNKEITPEPTASSSVALTEGEDLLLNCSFIFRRNEHSQEFTVYWIKSGENSSNCVYSYDSEYHSGIRFNQQCDVREELVYRLSNQTNGKNTTQHHIRISNLTGSDAGQYLCALQVNIEAKADWKIINDITVKVYNKGHTITEDKGSQRGGMSSIPFYAIIPILLVLAIAAVVLIWKKIKTSPGSQAIELKRNQQGGDMEETAEVEFSHYAVGNGEEEIIFRSIQDDLKPEGQKESKDIYSVVMLNDLYDPGLAVYEDV